MQSEKILVDKTALTKHVDSFIRVHDVEVPELNELLKIEKGNAVLKVKIASLNDHIQAKALASAPMLLLATVIDKIDKGEEVDVDVVKEQMYKNEIHPNTLFELEVFSRCVLEPEFTLKEVINMSEVFPGMINRIVVFALGINQQEE